MNKEVFEKMLQEFQEVNERINKCREFILDEQKFNELDPINRDLLIAQLKAMETYLSVLSIRLGINGTPANMPQDASEDSVEVVSDVVKTDDVTAGE